MFEPRFTFCHVGGDTFEALQGEQYSDQSSTEVLLFLHVCSQVVLLDESNIALFALELHFVTQGDIPMMQSTRNNILTPLLHRFCCFLHACPQVVLLDESDIALFAFKITFLYQWRHKNNLTNNLTTLLQGPLCFYMSVLFWIKLILHCFHLYIFI